MAKKKKSKYNLSTQIYKGIRLTLLDYNEKYYNARNAKRFLIGDPKKSWQNIWIPNACLDSMGTIKPNINIDWIFRCPQGQIKLRYAHETHTDLYTGMR